MNLAQRHIKWIMFTSGALTCTMVYAAIAPQAALRSTIGETLDGPLAEIIVRNWGGLVAMMGAILVYGAFHPPVRALAVSIAGASKLMSIALVLSCGTRFLGQRAGIAVATDLIWVVLFAWYLYGERSGDTEAQA